MAIKPGDRNTKTLPPRREGTVVRGEGTFICSRTGSPNYLRNVCKHCEVQMKKESKEEGSRRRRGWGNMEVDGGNRHRRYKRSRVTFYYDLNEFDSIFSGAFQNLLAFLALFPISMSFALGHTHIQAHTKCLCVCEI